MLGVISLFAGVVCENEDNDAFRDVVPLELKTLLKVTLLHGCFSRFLNCANGTKLRKASQICLIGVI